MARTPLFDVVRRSLRVAALSLDAPEPADEVLDRLRDERRIDRRRFLGYSAAAAAGLALQACALPAGGAARRLDRPVLVVGAGIAGLTAAWRLRQAGVPVRVLEAQDRVGGRMVSLRGFFPDGQVAEIGGELIDTNHERIRALAAELGLELDDLSAEPPGIASDVWWFGGRRRTEAEVVAAFRPVAERIVADLAPLGDADPTYRDPGGALALDRLSVAEWLDRAGVSGWVRDLLDVAYTTEYGLEIDRQSSLNLLFLIDPDPEPFRVFGESDERFHVRGGNDLVPRALAERLDDAVETGTVLEAVRRGADGSLACSFRRGGSAFELSSSHVLLTLPFSVLRSVRLDVELPPAKRRAIAELAYGTNAKLMIGFSGRPWRERHGSNGSVLADLPFQLTWETSRAQPGAGGILTNFTGGRRGVEVGAGSAAEQAARAVAELERVLPGVASAREGQREVRAHWPSHPWTLGSYAGYLPGQWTSIRGAEGEPVGGLHFAGEHTSLDFQGFMEGGCGSGERAAREILASLGTAAPPTPVPMPSAA